MLFISALTALFVALPFFVGKRSGGFTDVEEGGTINPVLERFRALEARKDSLYSAIRDIDLDYGLGKLTEDDYRELRQKYRVEAASVLKEIDAMTKEPLTDGLEADIEDEIKGRRAVIYQNTEEGEIENEILRARKQAHAGFSAPKNLICTECGNTYTNEDIFCSKCGAKLNG